MSAEGRPVCGEYGCTAPATARIGGADTCEEHRPLFYAAMLRLEELRRPARRRTRWDTDRRA